VDQSSVSGVRLVSEIALHGVAVYTATKYKLIQNTCVGDNGISCIGTKLPWDTEGKQIIQQCAVGVVCVLWHSSFQVFIMAVKNAGAFVGLNGITLKQYLLSSVVQKFQFLSVYLPDRYLVATTAPPHSNNKHPIKSLRNQSSTMSHQPQKHQ